MILGITFVKSTPFLEVLLIAIYSGVNVSVYLSLVNKASNFLVEFHQKSKSPEGVEGTPAKKLGEGPPKGSCKEVGISGIPLLLKVKWSISKVIVCIFYKYR